MQKCRKRCVCCGHKGVEVSWGQVMALSAGVSCYPGGGGLAKAPDGQKANDNAWLHLGLI